MSLNYSFNRFLFNYFLQKKVNTGAAGIKYHYKITDKIIITYYRS